MTITLNQNGIAAGTSDFSRSDGLSTGALISITSSVSSSVTMLWRPDDETANLNVINSMHWSITPTAGVYGSYLFLDGATNTKRIFAIRSPVKRLRVPALNESALPSGSLTNNTVLYRSGSNFNELSGSGPFALGNYGGWYSAYRELVMAVDSIASSAATAISEMSSPWIPRVGCDISWNDEFDAGSADLAARGWTVERWDTGATMTRAGDVSYHQNLAISSSQYRSTIVGSQIHIQTPTGIGIFIYKTFAAGNYMFGCRGNFPNLENGYFLRLYAYNVARDAAHPERSAYGAGSYANGTNSGRTQFVAINSSDTQLWNTDVGPGNPFNSGDHPFDTIVTDLRSTGLIEQGLWNLSNLTQRWRRTSVSSMATATVAAGVHIQSIGGLGIGTNDVNTVMIDWIRRDNSTPL